jgi:hypothetical protein
LCFAPEFKAKNSEITVVPIPTIEFHSFHPDILYVRSQHGQIVRCLDADYHSAIVFWSWTKELSVQRTIELFNRAVFADLGFLNCWECEVMRLESTFRATDLPFTSFWRRVKRSGIFMHSVNHPKTIVLAELAKAIAEKIGVSQERLQESTLSLLTDTLDAIRWPVYPNIAERYGDIGMYKWKIRKKKYLSLEEYVYAAFESYNTSGFKPIDLVPMSTEYKTFSALLSQSAGASI